MQIEVGSRMKGKVVSLNSVSDKKGLGTCEMSLQDGTKAVLNYEDIVWLDKEFPDPERTGLLQRLAEALVGKEIWVVVLDIKGGHVLAGKKQMFRQPKTNAEHMIARWESALTYNVISVIPGVATDLRLITGPNLKENGIFCQDSARGILLRSVCNTREGLRLWNSLAPKVKTDLRATMLVPKTETLFLVPPKWKERYSRSISVSGYGRVAEFDRIERHFLRVYSKCLDCGSEISHDLLNPHTIKEGSIYGT